MSPAERARRNLLGAVCVLVLAAYGFAARSGPLETAGGSAAKSYYNLLVEGFRSGRLSVAREAPAPLVLLPDPYDPAANVRWREAAEPLHDLSYYRGKLYLYFGIAPALLLFWPWAVLTGHYLLHRWAAAIFCSIAFLTAVALLRSVQRAYFSAARAGVLAAAALALGFVTGVPLLLVRVDVYEVAIACGAMGVFLSLAAVWRSLHRPAAAAGWLAVAGLAYGFAVASRPSLLPGAAMLLVPVFWERGAGTPGWKRWLGVLLPLVLVAGGLMIYNERRFGRLLEFGQRYQLASSRQDTARLFSPDYLWFNFRVYFLQPLRWSGHFPFVGSMAALTPPAGHAPPEDPFGALVSLPVLWLALAAPLAWRGRAPEERRPLRGFVTAVALLFGGCALFLGLFYWNASRYEVELLPALMLLAAVGALALERHFSERPAALRALGAGAGILLLYSVVFSFLASWARYAKAQSDLGGLYLDTGRPGEAITVLERAVRWQADPAAARVRLGNALSRQGRPTDALRQYAEVLRRDPNDFEARANAAIALAQAGRFEEAAAQYRQLVALRPDYAGAYRGLGFALARLGRGSEAIEAYAEGLRREPEDAEMRGNLANALAGAGRMAEAVGQFRAALRKRPDDAGLHGNLGLALAQGGEMGRASVEFQAAVRLDPASAKFHNYLGSAWASLGRLPEAIGEYEEALRINPAEPTARENLAAARAQRGGP
jgi:Flp pilus assembly protein TadD